MSAGAGANALPDMPTEQCAAALQPNCASWPDVGLAIVEFARDDSLKFIAVFGAVSIIIWLLYPRRSRLFQALYKAARRKAQQESSNSGDASHD